LLYLFLRCFWLRFRRRGDSGHKPACSLRSKGVTINLASTAAADKRPTASADTPSFRVTPFWHRIRASVAKIGNRLSCGLVPVPRGVGNVLACGADGIFLAPCEAERNVGLGSAGNSSVWHTRHNGLGLADKSRRLMSPVPRVPGMLCGSQPHVPARPSRGAKAISSAPRTTIYEYDPKDLKIEAPIK